MRACAVSAALKRTKEGNGVPRPYRGLGGGAGVPEGKSLAADAGRRRHMWSVKMTAMAKKMTSAKAGW